MGCKPNQEFQQTGGWLQDMPVRYRSRLRIGRRIGQHNAYKRFCSCETCDRWISS